jgi:hypothetical protein
LEMMTFALLFSQIFDTSHREVLTSATHLM